MSKLAVVLLALGMLAGVVHSSRIADSVASNTLSHVLRAGDGVPLPVVLWHGECTAHGTSKALQALLKSPLPVIGLHDNVGGREQAQQQLTRGFPDVRPTAASEVSAAALQAWETAAAAWAASAALQS